MEIASFSVEQLVGQQMGEYELLELVAAGTLSAVYTACQQETRHPVLLTVFLIPADFSLEAHARFHERFLLLASELTQLDHPHILPLYSYGEKYGYPFLVTPALPGSSLVQLLQKDGSLSPERTLELLKQIAAALDYAHLHGVVHGSLKAGNVLQDTEKNVLLTNFSLKQMLSLQSIKESEQAYAHLLSLNGSFFGAPEYMAPELVEGAAPSARSDIYALGILMYELLSGKLPFSGDDPLAVAFQHIEESVPPLQTLSPALTAALDLIIQRALEHDPVQRYSTARKLVEAFERVLSVVGKAGAPEKIDVAEKKNLVEAEEPVQEEEPHVEESQEEESHVEEFHVEESQEELQTVAPFLGSMKLPVVRPSKENEQRQGLLSGATPLPSVPQLSQISEVELSSSESGGWQFRPPIITNHMAAVKDTTGPQRALESYPPLPDLTAQKTQPGNLLHEEGELPIVPLGHHRQIDPATLILPADQHRRNDPDTLILPSTPPELANGELFPMGTLDNARQFWQESEPAKDGVDPHVWLSNTPEMTSFQSASMNPTNAYMPAPEVQGMPAPEVQGMPAPLAVDKGRRKTLALLATGGVVTLGLLGLGGVGLAHFMQNQGRSASKVNIPAIREKNPPKTLPKAVMIGKKSQPINSSLVFTNPSDKQDALLIHLANGNFVAYERACTHEQVPVNYDPQSHHLICPRHNSIFDPQAGAKVLSGPAPTPLKPVKIHINADGSIVLA